MIGNKYRSVFAADADLCLHELLCCICKCRGASASAEAASARTLPYLQVQGRICKYRGCICKYRGCKTGPPQPPPANQAFCSQHAAGERSAAPPSPPFCTSAPTAVRQCPLGSVLAGEQPYRSRSAAVSRSERSAQATRPPLAALATDLIASSISRPSASKLSMMDIVDREADAEQPRGG